MKQKKGFVKVDIELDDKILLKLALMAHESNMTLNAFVNKLLRKYIKELESKR